MMYEYNLDLEFVLLSKKSIKNFSLTMPLLSAYAYVNFVDVVTKNEKIYMQIA